MSVLIKGMEMPKNCAECCVSCKCMDRIIPFAYHEKRYPDCPLVLVPAPHGRLIDADVLFEKIPEGDMEHDVKISRTGAIADVCIWVLTAPTIIEAEGEG